MLACIKLIGFAILAIRPIGELPAAAAAHVERTLMTNESAPVPATKSDVHPSLAHLPVSIFALVMGTGVLAMVWRQAHFMWGIPRLISDLLLVVAGTLFLTLVTAYLVKVARYPQAVRAEVSHPISMPFVSTITVATLVIATALADPLPQLAAPLWWIGTVCQLLMMVVIISAWWRRPDITLDTMTPAWLIPVVGNIIPPLAARKVGSVELGWFCFGAAIIFWLGLLPLLLHRILTATTPLPTKLLPTLAILVAPPSVGFSSWYRLTGEALAPAARVLYAAAVIFALLVLVQVDRLRRVPFALPYAAYTFPAGAFAVATGIMAQANPAVGYTVIAVIALVLATVVVLGVFSGIVGLAVSKRLFLPAH
ncbi:MAG: SLAC1 anion channel family protein [Trueperella sp.]|nr:SLAC1 anion channel family protein [Trueperella sp.]